MLERLGEVNVEAGAQGAGAIFVAGARGEGDGGCLASRLDRARADALDERKAVFIGHGHVREHDVRSLFIDGANRGGGVAHDA